MVELTEALWMDEQHLFSAAELIELSGLSAAELQYLVECDALLPLTGVEPAADARFGAECLALARTASRLRNDFDLDASGLALTLRLLDRIHELEAEVRLLRAQWPPAP